MFVRLFTNWGFGKQNLIWALENEIVSYKETIFMGKKEVGLKKISN